MLLREDELAVPVDDMEAQVRRAEQVVAEEQHLAGHRVDLGMGGHRRTQRAVEVVAPDRLQVGVISVGQRGLVQRERLACVRDDARLRRDSARDWPRGLTGDRRLRARRPAAVSVRTQRLR